MIRTVFDGFCHRDFDPNIDGWRDEISKSDDFECTRNAESVLDMFSLLQSLQKENWELRKKLSYYEERKY